MVVAFRPFVFTNQGPDRDNPGPPSDPLDERMDVEGQAPARLVRIWARTHAKQPMGNKVDWKIVCIFNLASGLIKYGCTIANSDGYKKLSTEEEVVGADTPTVKEFFKYNVVPCRRMGDYLSVVFTVELTTSWKALVTNDAVEKDLGFYDWKIFNTNFSDPNVVPIGFLKDRTHARLQHSPGFQIERLKRLIDEAVGHEIPFEFAHRRATDHRINPARTLRTNPSKSLEHGRFTSKRTNEKHWRKSCEAL
jgi:hypothetical protein